MKTIKSITSIFLLVMIFMSVMTTNAFASNTADITIYPFNINYLTFTDVDPAEKEDNTAVYLYIKTGNRPSVRVSARGCNSMGENTENLTLVSGNIVNYVTCNVGTQYNIHSLINERGYNYATLWMKSPNVLGDRISGVWSPDSWGTYTSATT